MPILLNQNKNNYIKTLKKQIKPYFNDHILNIYRGARRKEENIISFINYLRFRNNYNYHTVFIAAGCRTASTWLAEILSYLLTGFKFYHPKSFPEVESGYDYNVNQRLLTEVTNKLYVIRGHTPPSDSNINAMSKNFQKYICTIRDPRDTIVSIKIHLEKFLEKSSFRDYGLKRDLPWETIKMIEYNSVNDQEKINLIIDKILPGITNMSEGWINHAEKNNNCLLVRYEDLTSNPLDEVNKIIQHYDFNVASHSIKNVIEILDPRKEDPIFTYFSKGKIGIWKDYLTNIQEQYINTKCTNYMSKMGYL